MKKVKRFIPVLFIVALLFGFFFYQKQFTVIDEEETALAPSLDYTQGEVYQSMKLYSEVQTYISYRYKPRFYAYQPAGYVNAVGIGAIYPVQDAELPDNFNVYIGKLKTFVLMKGDNQWRELDCLYPIKAKWNFRYYTIPWGTKESKTIPKTQMTITEDYIKFSLTKADLTNQVVHFWGTKQPCKSEDIIGMVTMYEFWSDTPGITGKLAATIGIDQRDDNGTISQAFSGRNYAVTNERRLAIGHNMPDNVYKWCVDNGFSPEICISMF